MKQINLTNKFYHTAAVESINESSSFSTVYTNRGIHEKGSGDVVSAIFYTTYNIYLSLFTQTAETTSPEPFS